MTFRQSDIRLVEQQVFYEGDRVTWVCSKDNTSRRGKVIGAGIEQLQIIPDDGFARPIILSVSQCSPLPRHR